MSSPTPSIPGMEQTVADLQRRVKALETGAAAQPAATAVGAAAFPVSAGDTSRWAGFSSLDYRPFYQWWMRMEWSTLDVSVAGTTSGDRSGQWRITCGDSVLYESTLTPGNTAGRTEETTVDLVQLLTDDPTARGALRRFTLDGRVVGGTAGAFYVMPDRLLFRGARFSR